MSKHIMLEYEGKEYTLEFTRRSIEMLERRGFKISDVTNRPMSVLPDLFNGAFLANHAGTKRKVIDEIFDRISNKQDLIAKLAELYNEPLEALIDGENVSEDQKITWDADF